MASIHVLTGTKAGQQFELAARETLIGRRPDCHIILPDTTVSRRHARITLSKEGYWVDDIGSQHGTRVNGEALRAPRLLSDRDEIQVSQVSLLFRMEAETPRLDAGSQTTQDRPSTIVTSINVLSDYASDDDSHTAPRLRALLEITRILGLSLDLKKVLPSVLDNIFQIFPQATRGCIMVANRPTGRLQPYAVKNVNGNLRELPVLSRTISDHVMTEGRAVLISDTADGKDGASESVMELQMHSILCAPLIGSAERPFGLIHLDSQKPTRTFNEVDLDVLVNIANLVGQAVNHAHLHETALQFDRRERDLATARQVQQHFLPRDRPEISGYELFDYYRPAEAVGGDYFGYIPLPGGQLAVAVGDVAGHGVPAALLMARLCSEARYCLATHLRPSEAVRALNYHLSRHGFSYFITFSLCVLDPIRHELTIVNAGHMPPLLRRARSGQVEVLGTEVTAPPLGIDPNLEFSQATAELEPGDRVMLYTDGISEAPNLAGSRYGVDRIRDICTEPLSPQALIERLLADVLAFSCTRGVDVTSAFAVEDLLAGPTVTQGAPQEDDVCVVSFARLPQ
ncbi:MAG: SpoIIE family protein phosphatase [Pirellulaceae bacterium]